jgi:hypothetical protein|tara:strand:+ start:159 stop:347 length:189 start_codon:yes stop_codon:yes gene_type:complete
MKKTVGIALITLGLTSCGSANYLPCPAYSSNDNYYETEAIHENLTQEEYYELTACQNCDEID